jgi:hypothetical protein
VKTYGEVDVLVYIHVFLTSALVGGAVSFMPRRLYPRENIPWYSLDRRMGGPQDRSEPCRVEKNLAPTGTRTPTPPPSIPVQTKYIYNICSTYTSPSLWCYRRKCQCLCGGGDRGNLNLIGNGAVKVVTHCSYSLTWNQIIYSHINPAKHEFHLYYTVFKILVPTSQTTHYVSITKTNWLIMQC